MKTYQDFLQAGQSPAGRAAFLEAAIAAHRASPACRQAREAMAYYRGENPTIYRYEKILYDMRGRAHRDMYTANHKIASGFFGFVVDQAVGYLLGNGVSFQDRQTKRALGRDFDQKLSLAAEYALIGGVSFGFWNLDHLEVFRLTEFVPLYDEENGALMAGIRFWQVAPDKPLRCTLYEPDGFTEYLRRPGEELEVLQKKRSYKLRLVRDGLAPTRIYDGGNYPGFPIVPLKNNPDCRGELCGRRNTLDALDLACSNMVNNVDEGNLIYWVLTNCGGMDELDDERFLYHLKTSHVTHADGDEGARAEAHTLEAPYAGTQTAIDMLEKKLYQDFQAFDASAVQAGNQTATAIRASYVPLDLKADRLERQVTAFVQGVLALAGLDDEPSYTRNQLVNKQEEMQTLLLMAPYVDEEYMTTKALTIMGDPDMAGEMLRRRAGGTHQQAGGGAEEGFGAQGDKEASPQAKDGDVENA